VAIAASPKSSAGASGSGRRRRATQTGIAALTLGALGVVFGDIGTSPLYAVQSVFNSGGGVHVTHTSVYGTISLIFWSITLVVSVKYLTFIMRADNRGEGGIMALTALLQGAKLRNAAVGATLVALGILGASLFYGDGAITPAISVLSAVAGLEVPVPSLASLVIPITVAVLCLLFAIQRFGTTLVGNLFGPVMLLWFGTIGLIGGVELVHHPAILAALSPTYAEQFLAQNLGVGFFALGFVVLAVTGAEALYADMGHFGRAPIHRAWFVIVFPCLTLNYLAQGSLILRSRAAIKNPFFILVPHWGQIPMVILATVATVIASQAVISGAFSLTQQAVQLGFLPRFAIRQTSAKHVGQIYVPAINASLFVTVVAIVIGFGSANALASAYGVAVTGTFVLNTILFLAIARLLWHKPWYLIALGAFVFLSVEVTFFAANVGKVVHGGWLPLAIASMSFLTLMTWRKGRAIVTANRTRAEGSLRAFMEQLGARDFPVRQIQGASVFLNPNLETTPLALRFNVEHNHELYDHVIIVSAAVQRVSHVPESERVVPVETVKFSGATGDPLVHAEQISAFELRFGFLDEPDIPAALRYAAAHDMIPDVPDIGQAVYYLTQITIVATDEPGMSRWRKRLFVWMAHLAANPARYFRLPAGSTVTTTGRIDL
jgi:KUP system potassium uptake protein